MRPPAARVRERAAAHWPVLPALATVLLVCVPAHHPPGGSGAGATLADAASGILVVCGAVLAVRARTRPLDRVAVAVLAAPVAALAAAAAAAQDPAAGLTGFVRLIQVFVLVPAALVLVLRSRRHARLVSASLAAVAVVQGAIGVHQYLTGTGASYRGEDVRAVGTFGPLDVMGMSSAVACGVVVALAAALAPPARAPRWLRPAALCTAAVLLVPLALSFSRGAWISTAAACAVLLVLAGLRTALRGLAVLLAAAVVLVGGFGVGGDLVAERAGSITEVADDPDQSVTDRYAMWAAAAGIWRENPATGVGPRGFAGHRDAHASLALSSASDTAGAGRDFHRQPLLSPHNMYLLLLAEQGLAGAVALVGGWAALLVLGVRRLLRARAAGRGTDCGLAAVGLLVMGCVDFLYADIGGPSTVLTAVSFGLAAWWALAPTAVSAVSTASTAVSTAASGGVRNAEGADTR
ncbi:O-antigen ligase [Streptomyces sp. DH37]|uniref:O-antigen ligase family protein n=1 Tax=Streptomyces sp. DH37 TaxID=3040122 RepID=UPI0024428FDF|nr:O-antigen ligase family protein [Streptomyces sp. DH37]MDG9704675.1 O-antigen ligase family protein [Streptomyces sp. DH37]